MTVRPDVVQGATIPAHDHVCWVYDDLSEFWARSAVFLSDGLSKGIQVRYICSGDRDDAIAGLAAAGLRGALAAGAVRVDRLADVYQASGQDPAAQVRAYAEETRSALSAGFSGLRVAAEATDLIKTPPRRDAFARYEVLVDRFIVAAPFSGMCGFDRTRLGTDAVAEVACLHPHTNDTETPFRWHADPEADARLTGQLDAGTVALFERALERTSFPDGQDMVIDAADLTFVDHRNLDVLARFARNHRATVVLRTALRTASKLVDTLHIADLRVETIVR